MMNVMTFKITPSTEEHSDFYALELHVCVMEGNWTISMNLRTDFLEDVWSPHCVVTITTLQRQWPFLYDAYVTHER